jgi:Icc protein
VRIHQISDLHIPDTDNDSRFSHIRGNVLRQLSFIQSENPDLLVISGDLTMEDASRAGCEWLSENLPDIPTVIIPGNHDDPDLVWELFGPTRCVSPRHYGEKIYEDCSIIFLDTSTDYLPVEQRLFLDSLPMRRPTLLFMHHPPTLIGDGFMSTNQPLHNHIEAAQSIKLSAVAHVFCGHFHNRTDLFCDGFQLHLTPSPAFQIPLHVKKFEMEESQPAVRTITIGDDVQTELIDV